jgi:hypothetical protein
VFSPALLSGTNGTQSYDLFHTSTAYLSYIVGVSSSAYPWQYYSVSAGMAARIYNSNQTPFEGLYFNKNITYEQNSTGVPSNWGTMTSAYMGRSNDGGGLYYEGTVAAIAIFSAYIEYPKLFAMVDFLQQDLTRNKGVIS